MATAVFAKTLENLGRSKRRIPESEAMHNIKHYITLHCEHLWMNIHILRWPVDSILEAVFTVSPNRQKWGIFCPTTPAHTGPEKEINPSKDSVFIFSIIFYWVGPESTW
jgi:hypothetical protein